MNKHQTVPHESLFWKALFGFDGFLRRRYGVIEYTGHPECIFRLRLIHSEYRLELADGTVVEPGGRLADLHFWNEQIPIFGKGTPPIRWMLRIQRCFSVSLRELLHYLSSHPELSDIKAIRGIMALGGREDAARLIRLSGYYGFEPLKAGKVETMSSLHQLGENILISLMVLARNSEALRLSSIRRVRIPVFVSRAELERRFGNMGRANERAWCPSRIPKAGIL